MYNGYAAQTNDFICPTGYHVPTIEEWLTLINFLQNSPEEIKESFNITRFGYRYWEGPFSTNYCGWWSSSDEQPNFVSTALSPSGAGINNGHSIRCIKNNNNN